MLLSGRNKIPGRIISIKQDQIMTELVIEHGDIQICGVITTSSAEAMNLRVGDTVTALIKSTSVSFVSSGGGNE
ncbi:MAG: molybdenum-pterin-binding protein [Candidatus Wallbacteria bacterium HGW-Wallbacteria-1]|jgi:molybdopterin-binding protein|uniref:Molybdenum-pterin-binding protein n=1 Tax=Candidatus Wallbacteria bacterium HGW-Wallbacteria-1 TaxID=2013854 RepID=A0A2N1PND8_9BACT|nr:MAG: molybdenum-pterin-binding protein [Candidatus Wallbacteria bacterium HGW-Wallbacteria-1]